MQRTRKKLLTVLVISNEISSLFFILYHISLLVCFVKAYFPVWKPWQMKINKSLYFVLLLTYKKNVNPNTGY